LSRPSDEHLTRKHVDPIDFVYFAPVIPVTFLAIRTKEESPVLTSKSGDQSHLALSFIEWLRPRQAEWFCEGIGLMAMGCGISNDEIIASSKGDAHYPDSP
jgi:hypothetical protein